ncbi:hypothetical protein, partial [Streptomyces sp. NPDC057582]|uniref:hypothetical protein n=1 Tax=Streptomyces sp. NPDC057582 TaxID=3346174 RepID=UPI0036AEA440
MTTVADRIDREGSRSGTARGTSTSRYSLRGVCRHPKLSQVAQAGTTGYRKADMAWRMPVFA